MDHKFTYPTVTCLSTGAPGVRPQQGDLADASPRSAPAREWLEKLPRAAHPAPSSLR
jgi:hypothetical protein